LFLPPFEWQLPEIAVKTHRVFLGVWRQEQRGHEAIRVARMATDASYFSLKIPVVSPKVFEVAHGHAKRDKTSRVLDRHRS
jgi:hypothetical protein